MFKRHSCCKNKYIFDFSSAPPPRWLMVDPKVKNKKCMYNESLFYNIPFISNRLYWNSIFRIMMHCFYHVTYTKRIVTYIVVKYVQNIWSTGYTGWICTISKTLLMTMHVNSYWSGRFLFYCLEILIDFNPQCFLVIHC